MANYMLMICRIHEMAFNISNFFGISINITPYICCKDLSWKIEFFVLINTLKFIQNNTNIALYSKIFITVSDLFNLYMSLYESPFFVISWYIYLQEEQEFREKDFLYYQ